MYTRTIARRNKRKFDLLITFAFLFSLLCSLPAATVSAQAGEPNEPPTTPVEENLPDLNSLTNHLFLPFVNSNAIDPVPADVRESVEADELASLATNVVRCNERSSWIVGKYYWSNLIWNNVISGCPNIYVNPSVSGYVQVVYYSNSQGRWVWKPYRWVRGGTWTEMGNNFSAGTIWYARFYNVSSQNWVQLKTTSGRLITSNPPAPQPGNPADLLTHSQAVALLSSGGITQITSSGGCTDKTKPNCTSLDGVRRGSLQGLIDFKTKCDAAMGNCTIRVTGGTEVGHSNGTHSHANGYKIDINWTFTGNTHNDAGRYIRANFTQGTPWVSSSNVTYTPYVDPSTGYRYLFEDYRNHTSTGRRGNTHWDICFVNGC